MRTCPSCGRENPSDQDFCSCGEYLRWEPTIGLPAVTVPEPAPPGAAPPAGVPPPGGPPVPPASPAAAPPVAGPPAVAPPSAAAPGHAVVPAASTAPVPSAPAPAAPARVSLHLSVPDADVSDVDGPIALAVDPGGRVVVRALVRNQSDIVDNYDLELRGLPDGWWTIAPGVVYLVPYGSPGSYEQAVEVHVHPPRAPEAEARLWELHVVARSRAAPEVEAVAPFIVGIRPYEELEAKVLPPRRAGRRKVVFDVEVANKANAEVVVGMAARDDEGSCRTLFAPPTLTLPPGGTQGAKLTVRPPKQIFLGRPRDRRIDVEAAGGEAGEALAAEAAAAGAAGGGGLKAMAGQYVKAPTASLGPGGLNVRGPAVRKPRAQAGRIDLTSLLAPSPDAQPAVARPPTQVTFRQRPWLPWWLAIVAPLLVVALLALLLSRTEQVEVPSVVGSASVFAAQSTLEKAGLTLNPATQAKPDPTAPPGSVVGQTPPEGGKVDKGSAVAVLVATGTGDVKVPSVVGKTLAEADQVLRTAKLALGASSKTPPDPKEQIRSQIPAAGQVVKEGSPIAIFYAEAKAGASGGSGASGGKGGGGAGASGGGGAKGGGAPVTLPALNPDAAAMGAALSGVGLVPEVVQRFSEAKKGQVFGTEPAPGAAVPKGATVTLLVSAGFPQLAYDDDENVLLIDGASGKKLPAVAKGKALEKDPTWSADAKQIAYTSAGSLMLADVGPSPGDPTQLSEDGERFGDPSFAPTTEAQVLAAARLNDPDDRNDTDLCVGKVTGDGWKPSCVEDPRFGVGEASWSPDGKTILVPAVGKGGAGIVRYRSKVAFSARADDWGKGTFVTPRDADAGTAVIDAAISPDGKTLAAVANLDTDEFRLYLTTPDDVGLEKADPSPVQACKVAWRGDSRELVIVQAGAQCDEPTGQLSRIDLAKPTDAVALVAGGDNPAFQPLVPGG